MSGRKRRRGSARPVAAFLCEDRDTPGRYLQIVFFESYEAAMENSAMPETDAFSSKMMTLAEGPPTHVLQPQRDRRSGVSRGGAGRSMLSADRAHRANCCRALRETVVVLSTQLLWSTGLDLPVGSGLMCPAGIGNQLAPS
jgi:hypothetical protein